MGKRISELDGATTPDGSELVVLVQGGTTKRSTVSAMTPSTIALLNAQITDATLIDTADSRLSDARTPTAHDLDAHGSNTLAELSAIVSDATLAALGNSQTWAGAQRPTVTTLTYAATILINALANDAFYVVLTGAAILGNPSGPVARGDSWTVEVEMGGAGSYALTFDTNYVGPASATGASPLDTTSDVAGKIRLLTCYAHSATKIQVMETGEAV